MPPRQPWAFELSGQDDGTYMLGGETYRPPAPQTDWRFGRLGHPHPATCPACGAKADKAYVDPLFRVKKRRRDLTVTYDGGVLVSQRMRSLLLTCGATEDDFRVLPADLDFFWLYPRQVLDYEAGRRNDPCAICGEYFDEVGPIPSFLNTLTAPLTAGVYRSSLEFGSVPLKSWALVVGVETARAMADAGLKGLEMSELHRT